MKHKSSRMALLIFLLCAAGPVSAQHFLRTWAQSFNGPGNDDDETASMVIDRNDHVFITGRSARNGTGSLIYDYATIAYSSSGAPWWTNIFDSPAGGSDFAYAIALSSNGNVFVTGSATVTSADYGTIGYANSGIPLWTNFYDGPAHDTDVAFAEAVDTNGNVFVTGRSMGIGTSFDYATIAYSAAGVPLWTNRYNGPGNGDDTATAIAIDGQGNLFVTGHSAGTNGFSHYATIAYSNSGAPLWTNRYEGGYGSATAIAVDTNGNVIVTGNCTPTPAPNHDEYATLKYSAAGIPQWTNRYDGPGGTNDIATALAVNQAGDVFVTGFSAATKIIPDSYDYATIKYSSGGVPQWTNRYDGPGHYDDEAAAIALDTNGNAVVTGYFWGSFSDGGNDPHCATIAYSGDGLPLWTNEYVSLYNEPETANAIAIDSRNHVYVGGTTSGFFDDYLVFQLAAAQPIPLNLQPMDHGLVLMWTNAGFTLQAAPAVTGVFTNIPVALSPYTNLFTDPQMFFRLIAN